jgi:hypothetical protein
MPEPEDRTAVADRVSPTLAAIGQAAIAAAPHLAGALNSQLALAEYRREEELAAVRRLLHSWPYLSDAERQRRDPSRYRAELLNRACPRYGYLHLPWVLGYDGDTSWWPW